MLKEMISENPNKFVALKVFAVKDLKELSWDENNQIRRCSARVFTNAGSDEAAFKIYWINRRTGEYYYETE